MNKNTYFDFQTVVTLLVVIADHIRQFILINSNTLVTLKLCQAYCTAILLPDSLYLYSRVGPNTFIISKYLLPYSIYKKNIINL